jgi:hypothetical protein
MADSNKASNYAGRQGKTNVIQQGQTRGAYGSTENLQRREPSPPADQRP